MHDVLIVGAGPAGTVAAIVLARAGARVRLVDRARFPRHKLCGDTLNPGALAVLRRLHLDATAESKGIRIDGMVVTGPDGVAVEGRYPESRYGRAIGRTEFDWALVNEAIRVGVDFEEGVAVRAPVIEPLHDPAVSGVEVRTRGGLRTLDARLTIAADGRHSTIGFALGLSRHPRRPRRWAMAAYFTGVAGMTSFGEMHIRPAHYIGVAPLPGGITNACLVSPSFPSATARRPLDALRAALRSDPVLGPRFAEALVHDGPFILGPLAVDAVPVAETPDRLLLAGDAAGFVDPMTGDGLRFAIRGGELAAAAACAALSHGWSNQRAWLLAERRREFASKVRLNRVLRGIVGSPMGVRLATHGARVVPGVIRALILRASDCATV